MRRIYLDNAATTPVDKRVEKAMRPFWRAEFGNPSALYREGVVAKEAVARARRDVAEALGAHSDEIVFTGSGTESDNLAIFGAIKFALGNRTSKLAFKSERAHIITSVIEHPAVLNACKALERDGVDVTYLGVNERGLTDPKSVKEALREDTVLVSIMYANNEIGTIQPIREIAKAVRDWKKERGSVYPYMHSDACQATQYLEMNVARLGVDLLSFNGSKIYGPKGVGALFVKRGVRIDPMIYGGGQERGLRSGTENVSAIVGFAEAVKMATEMKEKESARLSALRDHFIEKLLATIMGSILNGDAAARLPNNVNISIPRIDSEQLVIELDAKGVAASARSACKSRDYESSYVIMALKRTSLPDEGSIRFSLGRETTKKEIAAVLKVLPAIVKKIQY